MNNIEFEPFLLSPVGKDYLWGGTRLKTEYNKNIDLDPLAETWECSTHPDGMSKVASGSFLGKTLDEVVNNYPELLGVHGKEFKQFPIMIKFIDAKKDLSVQVHPDDDYARIYENNSLGKTEMWYVLDALEDASLIYGFNKDMSKEELREMLNQGTIEKCLQKVKIKKGDVFFIPAGQVHAICSGALIAEIQENSNVTYRLYDYNRVGKDGKKRELHIEKALNVVNLNSSAKIKQPSNITQYREGYTTELLCKCKYFHVEKMLLNTEDNKDVVKYKTNELSFHVLLCIDGNGTMQFNEKLLEFRKGDCIFIPANSSIINIIGSAIFLDVSI